MFREKHLPPPPPKPQIFPQESKYSLWIKSSLIEPDCPIFFGRSIFSALPHLTRLPYFLWQSQNPGPHHAPPLIILCHRNANKFDSQKKTKCKTLFFPPDFNLKKKDLSKPPQKSNPRIGLSSLSLSHGSSPRKILSFRSQFLIAHIWTNRLLSSSASLLDMTGSAGKGETPMANCLELVSSVADSLLPVWREKERKARRKMNRRMTRRRGEILIAATVSRRNQDLG